jgi:hypothetical protein
MYLKSMFYAMARDGHFPSLRVFPEIQMPLHRHFCTAASYSRSRPPGGNILGELINLDRSFSHTFRGHPELGWLF